MVNFCRAAVVDLIQTASFRFPSGSCSSGVEGQGRCAFAAHDLAARELLLEELNAEAVLAVVAVVAFFIIVAGLPSSIIFHARSCGSLKPHSSTEANLVSSLPRSGCSMLFPTLPSDVSAELCSLPGGTLLHTDAPQTAARPP